MFVVVKKSFVLLAPVPWPFSVVLVEWVIFYFFYFFISCFWFGKMELFTSSTHHNIKSGDHQTVKVPDGEICTEKSRATLGKENQIVLSHRGRDTFIICALLYACISAIKLWLLSLRQCAFSPELLHASRVWEGPEDTVLHYEGHGMCRSLPTNSV